MIGIYRWSLPKEQDNEGQTTQLTKANDNYNHMETNEKKIKNKKKVGVYAFRIQQDSVLRSKSTAATESGCQVD